MRVMADIEYRGYSIQANSYKDDEGKWIPQVLITPPKGIAQEMNEPLTWERKFDTKEEADSFALDGGEFYINNKL